MASRILYVDDDRNLCQIVAKALRGEGYSVRTAYDGDEALATIADDPPDLILLDVMLPRRDGFEVLTEIRALRGAKAHVPVVLVSGCSPTPAYAQRANILRAVDLLSKPVPLEKLLEVVNTHVGEAKDSEPVVEPTRRRVERRARAISGAFEKVPFPALLHHLHGLRATGVLHLAQAKKRKWIHLRDGYTAAVRSNMVKETLGHFLERIGRISQAVLEETKRQMDESAGRRQGEILVAMDVLTDDELAEALHDQADEKLFEIFGWETGTFRFERGSGLQRANALGVGRSPANTILEGVRSRFSIERVDRYIQTHRQRLVAHGESPFYRFQEIHLDPHQEAVLRGLDGSQQLGDFLREEEDLRRTVYGLLACGLLELHGKADTNATAVAAKPTAEARSKQKPGALPLPAGASVAAAAEARTPGAGVTRTSAEDARRTELATMADQLRAKSYFEILGIEPGTGDAEIREAYESVSARAHPDRFAGENRVVRELAAEIFSLVTEAYETLADPRARQQYLLDHKQKEREHAERQRTDKALEAASAFREGEEALAKRDYEGALQHFGLALQLYPEEGDHHTHYGWALHLCHPGDASMVGEALEHVKRGLKLASHRETAYLYFGRLYKAVGRVETAEKMFTRAVQIAPECVEAIRELRLIHMRREKSKGLIGRLLRR